MTAGDFSVAEVDGGLECELASGAGTTADNNAKTITVASDVVLIDASVCHTTATSKQGHAFRLSREVANAYDDFGTKDTHVVENDANSALKWLYKTGSLTPTAGGTPDTVRFFVAVSWTMTFKYNFATEAGNVGVYLDLKDSSMTTKANGRYVRNTEATKKTSLGFRIGFFGSATGNHNVVWAKNSIGAGANDWHGNYVQKEADTAPADPQNPQGTDNALGTYNVGNATTLGDIVFSDGEYDRCDDETTATQNDYLNERVCTITRADMSREESKGVSVTCVAWYEGTDPNVVSGAAMECMQASMTFYARTDA
jgi:hypothetical protein